MWLKEKLEKCRNSKNCRMWFIALLIFIVLALIIFWWKAKTALWIILVLLAIAFAVEWYDYDADLGKLWKTWNYSESRVETVTDKEWNKVRLIWKCVKWDVNCDNFSSQNDAQKVYDDCAQEIAKSNIWIENPKKLDIYWLDRDKDGIVCEHLPAS